MITVALHKRMLYTPDMRYIEIPVGSIYNRWKIIGAPFRRAQYTFANCICSCGTKKEVNLANVVSGLSKSCGCWNLEAIAKRNFRHGDCIRGKREKLYSVWATMLQRCNDANSKDYKYYGGRGIKIIWPDYQSFREWAIAGGYKNKLSIERIDVNGNYEPSNCKWIPQKQQSRNRRDTKMLTAFGETKGIADWFDDPRCKAIPFSVLSSRIHTLKWEHEKAIATPKLKEWSRRTK